MNTTVDTRTLSMRLSGSNEHNDPAYTNHAPLVVWRHGSRTSTLGPRDGHENHSLIPEIGVYRTGGVACGAIAIAGLDVPQRVGVQDLTS